MIVLKYLIVKFPDREAKFLYPSAFEKGYLKVEEACPPIMD